MNAIVQGFLDSSTLEVALVRIEQATKDSFVMSIESKVAKTGPLTATMSEMTVDMIGPGGIFGRLELPEVRTRSSGTDVIITNQKVQIVNMEAFKEFVKSIIQDEESILRLENGHGTIKSWGLTASIVYRKDVRLKGMKGLRTVILRTEPDGVGFKNTMLTINPSSLEIDLGIASFEIRNYDGVKIGEQKGKSYLKQGESVSVAKFTRIGNMQEKEARLIGLGVEEDNWYNEIITAFDTPVTLTGELAVL